MPSTTITRPTKYDAYECDGPTCREVCESFHGASCRWIELPMPHDRREHRYFHSWACLAEFACWSEEHLPLQVCEAPAIPRLPF